MSFNQDKIKKSIDQLINWFKTNGKLLTGLFIIVIGIILILNSKELLLNLLTFIIGLILIYYGLILIKAKKITAYIDEKIIWFKRKLRP